MEENNCLSVTPSLLFFITLLNAVHITGKVIVIPKVCINISLDLRFKINHLIFVISFFLLQRSYIFIKS